MSNKKIINITVKNKRAAGDGTVLICDNSDYRLRFSFDSDWEGMDPKTARMVWGGKHRDFPFTGSEVDLDRLPVADMVSIGVYAGDIKTSTSAIFRCSPSILSSNPVHVPPPEDVYNEIMKLIGTVDDAILDVEELPPAGHIKPNNLYRCSGKLYHRVGDKWAQLDTDLTDFVARGEYDKAMESIANSLTALGETDKATGEAIAGINKTISEHGETLTEHGEKIANLEQANENLGEAIAKSNETASRARNTANEAKDTADNAASTANNASAQATATMTRLEAVVRDHDEIHDTANEALDTANNALEYMKPEKRVARMQVLDETCKEENTDRPFSRELYNALLTRERMYIEDAYNAGVSVLHYLSANADNMYNPWGYDSLEQLCNDYASLGWTPQNVKKGSQYVEANVDGKTTYHAKLFSVVARTPDNQVRVNKVPKADDDATAKMYVDSGLATKMNGNVISTAGDNAKHDRVLIRGANKYDAEGNVTQTGVYSNIPIGIYPVKIKTAEGTERVPCSVPRFNNKDELVGTTSNTSSEGTPIYQDGDKTKPVIGYSNGSLVNFGYLNMKVSAEKQRATEAESELDAKVAEETSRATEAEGKVSQNLANHIETYNAKVTELDVKDQSLTETLDTFMARVTAILECDDITLDEWKEVVAYIKNNKTLIDGITTSKVSVSDIIDVLTSTATNKPLSANQGRALKALIDGLATSLNDHKAAYNAKITELNNADSANASAIANEAARATEAESALDKRITEEIERATQAEQDNAEAIAAEKARAEGMETVLQTELNNDMFELQDEVNRRLTSFGDIVDEHTEKIAYYDAAVPTISAELSDVNSRLYGIEEKASIPGDWISAISSSGAYNVAAEDAEVLIPPVSENHLNAGVYECFCMMEVNSRDNEYQQDKLEHRTTVGVFTYHIDWNGYASFLVGDANELWGKVRIEPLDGQLKIVASVADSNLTRKPSRIVLQVRKIRPW